MVNGIGAAEILNGVRGAAGADKGALAELICSVSRLVDQFPEISEVDLNPVFAGKDGAVAADVRIIVDFKPAAPRFRPSQAEIVSRDEPDHETRRGRGDRSFRGGRQDRQLGDAQSHRRRLRRSNLPDPSAT